jgi:hypothetical protein
MAIGAAWLQDGKIQPTADDPFIALKKTRWENNQQAVRRIRIEG